MSERPASWAVAGSAPRGSASVATLHALVHSEAADERPHTTGLPELDRVLAGGLVSGSVTLLGGEPGIGKSTLALQVLAALQSQDHAIPPAVTGPAASTARAGVGGLLVAGEESVRQVSSRAARLGLVVDAVRVIDEPILPGVLAQVESLRPRLLVVDSIQTLVDPGLAGTAGSVGQVRGCAQQLVRVAKAQGVTVIVVGHVTKGGALAGPRALEHIVDTVLSFEGDRHHALRLVHAVKHRFGPTHELGVLEMTPRGLVGVDDPSRVFLADRPDGAPGSVVVPVLHGLRPLLAEVQALVAPGSGASGRRFVQGVDARRLAMVLGVLEQRAEVRVGGAEVYVSVAGGLRIDDPAADLAVAVAVASARLGRAVPRDLVVLGEFGLAGEVRQVPQLERRLAEAARLGFRRALVPAPAVRAPNVDAGSTPAPAAAARSCAGVPDEGPDLEVVRVSTLRDTCRLAFGDDDGSGRTATRALLHAARIGAA